MLDTNIFNRVVERQLPLYVPKSPQKISDGRRQRLSLLDSVCCSLDGSKCGPLPDLPSPRLAIVAASDYKKVDHVLAESRSGAVVGGVDLGDECMGSWAER
jgi:hypothetical protein